MGEVLSQGEVDALLRGVSEGEVETESDQPEEVSGVTPYDLTSQEKIIRGRLPTLDIINQMFSSLFRNTFSSMLRKAADVSTVSTDTIKFGEFLRSLPVPSSLHIFRMEPLRGHGLMVVESKLVSAIVDTFFGGTGSQEAKITGRDFSAIEIRMTKNVVLSALKDLEKAWKPVHAVSTNYVRSEVNPQFAAIVPPTDIVLVILFDIELENISGSITICLPYAAIEPIIPKLKAQFQSEEMEIDQVWVRRLRTELLQTEVEMVAELGVSDTTPGRLLEFKVGDTIMLGNDVTDPLFIKVEGVPKFKGFSGVSRGTKAIQVTEVIEREG
ncbi:MAG: flagellar motor switch protein FliM [Nitrospinaceae bacterium]|jgi:flagellar motor switch protein FliM|nr:flagellar motor switch protein FliM [Nitrospinaceae bacterium]MDP7149179.1 flagellar motor switch protein FliM [Nitrospinaceae bacterium]|tara:strand:+ start:279 stop:1259 length:981 start_codon:yes stop_codon:yes gene_type:complete